MRAKIFVISLIGLQLAAVLALAQDKGTLDPKPLPPLANPSDPATPAKELFGRARAAAPLEPDPIGFYSRGCLAGGEQLPINGSHWQVMRLSRNRNWGHPRLVAFLKKFAPKAAAAAGWPGLLIGDMSQPRGGPMLTGHASHQIGLDADVWLTPAPATLSRSGPPSRVAARPSTFGFRFSSGRACYSSSRGRPVSCSSAT